MTKCKLLEFYHFTVASYQIEGIAAIYCGGGN